jgi:uncharacterized protein (DUF486 family)
MAFSFLRAMNEMIQTRWLPIVLLTCSNIFMTFAWSAIPDGPAPAARHLVSVDW